MIGYISRDKVASTLCAGCAYNCSTVRKETHPCMDLKELMSIQPEDVAPVRHGRWESFEDVFMETCYQCSECGLSFYLADGGTPKENEYHYCPNCGARMDGESDE